MGFVNAVGTFDVSLTHMTSMYVCVCMYVCMYVCIYVCVYVHVCVCGVYACVRVCGLGLKLYGAQR